MIPYFVRQWVADTQNVIKTSYSLYKHVLYFDSDLNSILAIRYKTALARLRTSPHVTDRERGRHTIPKTAIWTDSVKYATEYKNCYPVRKPVKC